MRILITGATGFIGKELGKALVREGHELYVVSRHPDEVSVPYPCTALSIETLEAGRLKVEFDAVINLAGESVMGRWTSDKKHAIWTSRIDQTKRLAALFTKGRYHAPSVWINGSAVGFYGSRGDEVLDETSSKGSGYLADVCVAWEHATEHVNSRIVHIRTGVVLGPHGGMIGQLLPLFRANLGSAIGNGKQWMSWIHIQDEVRAIQHALTTEDVRGPINLVAPQAVTNHEFTALFKRAVGQKINLPNVPAFVLKAMLGEGATVALSSQRVTPKKLLETGFKFQFSTLERALDDIVQDTGDHELYAEQWIPKPKKDVFEFFSDEKNLELLTPEILNFKVLRKSTEKIEENTLIDYNLKIRGIPAHWRTRIEEWQPGAKFVDTQLSGPYKKWHHTHLFEELGSGTLITDRVLYQLPFKPLGNVALPIVKKDISRIFEFRRKVINERFGSQIVLR
jgi:uncharacterized protein (TIGR01777 family)